MSLLRAELRAATLAVALAGSLAASGLAEPRRPRPEEVEALVREAEDLAWREAFGPAAAKLETALREAERLGDPSLTVLCLDRMGLVLGSLGEHEAAAERHARALALAREIGDTRAEASVLASIGASRFRRSDYDAARVALGDALALQEDAGDDAGRARTLDFLGRVHFKRAAYDDARAAYLLALEILDGTGDARWRSLVLEDLGDLEQERGFYRDALLRYEAALASRKEIADRPGEVYVQHLIGRCYMLQGANREALSWFERADAQARSIGDVPGRALAVYHMGIALDRQGAHEESLVRYREALALKQRLDDRRQQAWILARMGDANAALSRWSTAVSCYLRAIALWRVIQDPRGVASGLDKAGRAYFRLRRYDEALAALEESARILEAGQPAFLAPTVALTGRVQAARGDSESALASGQRAIALARGVGNEEVLWSVAYQWGAIQRALDRREEALASWYESLAAIERVRARVAASDEARAGYLEGKQAVYGDTIELLVELGRVEEALELAERARARAFLDLLGGRVSGADTVVEPPSVAEIREEARSRDATILEYFAAERRLFLWSVEPNGTISGASRPISRRELSRLAEQARRRGSESRPALRTLYRAVIEPLAPRLPEDPERLVTIIPHGPLFLVSFAALLAGDGKYVVDRHTLAYSPAIGVLRFTRGRRTREARAQAVADPPELLLVGNPEMPPAPGKSVPLAPLPEAEEEARVIGSLYPSSRVTALTGRGAREATVRTLAPRESIIHLATHAVLFDDEPLASFLALAPAGGTGSRSSEEDGRLTVREVFDLELSATLVTLSACNTGLGLVNGDGVLGLSRAFLHAGAPSVLVSLWRVADPIARFQMERFYRALIARGGDKAAAIRTAELETIRALRQSRLRAPSGRALPEDPHLWAPFVLVGEAR